MILLLLISNNLLSLELKGKIIHISDGDTVHLLTDNKEKIKIRLNDIDAPESKQAFGNKSKENLKNDTIEIKKRIYYEKKFIRTWNFSSYGLCKSI